MLPLRYPLNILVSFHYAKAFPLNTYRDNGLRIIADSGAFSAESQGAEINLVEFAEWATNWRDCFAWVASLDVIGNAEASWANYTSLRHGYGIDVVPTVLRR